MGGSASIAEMVDRVATDMQLSDNVLAVRHGDGSQSEVEYRIAWARTFLKKAGAIDNSERGVWTLTSKGRDFTEKDAADVLRQVRATRKRKQPSGAPDENAPSDEAGVAAESAEVGWKDRLLGVLKGLPPDRFERLCQRILRESGFTKVEVRGRWHRWRRRPSHEPGLLSRLVSVQALEGRGFGSSHPRFSRSNDWAGRQRIDHDNGPFHRGRATRSGARSRSRHRSRRRRDSM